MKRRRGTPRDTEPERINAANEANRRRGQESQALKLAEAGWLVIPPEDVDQDVADGVRRVGMLDRLRANRAAYEARAAARRRQREEAPVQ